ncbi:MULTISPECIES: hypothetical protein [Psychrilyobacter]|uniref:Uncharacterized protein n=1 Tax=Psychrilyobacter piezotolerans TaxID=2293438 RepID=A0ABX9KDG3_9FUSO|nr:MULTISPECIES: hypothetical protein [Psychrilyobacter]MCS5422858.1 hypothetical protein [Psychrilyobacter sp. S5]NDI79087.1 hypothetical protein [Psychrilyobacter piezotolerans]RDE59004.1 hypothetical protein DV867_14310 [Psychrilyobacter sp. S5]REI39576.1 hypothetical protein DYH56_14310 [Psychrilyobacter piezotolerans]
MLRKKNKHIFRKTILIFLGIVLVFAMYQYIQARREVLYNRENGPESAANILEMGIEESSGIILSEDKKDYYWTHGDSVDYNETPRTSIHGFRFDSDGAGEHHEVFLDGAANLDWGDIARDKSGNLIVADTGDNLVRKNYVLYRFKEPELDQKKVEKNDIDKIIFRFPGGEELNNEAVFYADKSIYILNKEYGKTRIYRLMDKNIHTGSVNTAVYIGEFKFLKGSRMANYMDAATGADISRDEMTMVFNTYKGIYLFKREKKNTNFFDGKVYYHPLKWDSKVNQYEAVAFTKDEKNLILTTEQGNLYKVDVEDFKLLREAKPTEPIKDKVVEVGGDRKGITSKIKHMTHLIRVKIMDMIFR